SVASTTFRRPDMERGFEADESFYIRHAQTIRSKMEIDLERDPPPELVVEIELTSPVVRKFGILAAIGVPEVWIHNGETLQIHLLGEQDYAASKTSKVLVGFPVAKVDELIRQRHQRGEIELIKEFRHSLLS
ncbi:MAG: Uma2 family endonuclease, partial [Planctomycetota bacterium]